MNDAGLFLFLQVNKAAVIRFEYMAKQMDVDGRIGILGWKAQQLGLLPAWEKPSFEVEANRSEPETQPVVNTYVISGLPVPGADFDKGIARFE